MGDEPAAQEPALHRDDLETLLSEVTPGHPWIHLWGTLLWRYTPGHLWGLNLWRLTYGVHTYEAYLWTYLWGTYLCGD